MKNITTTDALAEAARKARRDGYPYSQMPTGYLPEGTCSGLTEPKLREEKARVGSARLLERINAVRGDEA